MFFCKKEGQCSPVRQPPGKAVLGILKTLPTFQLASACLLGTLAGHKKKTGAAYVRTECIQAV